ncbi:MAG: hypothetical protein JSW47_03580, partial [Phycisphaerales bacterium]
KLFIASLADPALLIRVATPITEHVDECPACLEDLRNLKDLQLSHVQLCRLGQLLAYKPGTDKVSCSKADPAVDPVASMAFHETSAEHLKHLCTCPECRKRLYRRREDIRRQLPQDERVESELYCESIQTRDIFDFCVPYGVDPADRNFVESHERLTSHLRTCPRCLARMQSVHETIYHIAGRPDSRVVTYFALQEEDEPAVDSEANDVFADRRIDIQSLPAGNIEEAASTNIIPAAVTLKLKRRLSTSNLKRYAKLAVAAAAMIIVYVLFSSTPPAQALDPAIVKAIKTVDNVYIATYNPDREEPRQEKWVSRSLGVRLLKTGERFSLSSIPDRVLKTRNPQNDEIREVQLTGDDIAVMRKAIDGTLGIIPFDDVSNLPPDSEWTKLPGETTNTTDESVEVYELTFRDDLDLNRARSSRWRYFVDSKSSLPQRIQIYRSSGANEDYKMHSQLVIRYPNESEVKAAIESVSF